MISTNCKRTAYFGQQTRLRRAHGFLGASSCIIFLCYRACYPFVVSTGRVHGSNGMAWESVGQTGFWFCTFSAKFTSAGSRACTQNTHEQFLRKDPTQLLTTVQLWSDGLEFHVKKRSVQVCARESQHDRSRWNSSWTRTVTNCHLILPKNALCLPRTAVCQFANRPHSSGGGTRRFTGVIKTHCKRFSNIDLRVIISEPITCVATSRW